MEWESCPGTHKQTQNPVPCTLTAARFLQLHALANQEPFASTCAPCEPHQHPAPPCSSPPPTIKYVLGPPDLNASMHHEDQECHDRLPLKRVTTYQEGPGAKPWGHPWGRPWAYVRDALAPMLPSVQASICNTSLKPHPLLPQGRGALRMPRTSRGAPLGGGTRQQRPAMRLWSARLLTTAVDTNNS
jgi:hypothetical protein